MVLDKNILKLCLLHWFLVLLYVCVMKCTNIVLLCVAELPAGNRGLYLLSYRTETVLQGVL